MRQHAARFVIYGEDFTRIARDLMLDGEPGKAWKLIAQNLLGGDNVEKLAMELLDGKKKLIGNSTDGIEFVDDNNAAYQKQVAKTFAGRVRVGGQWWRPRAEVTDFGPDDAGVAMKRGFAPVSSLGEANVRNMLFYKNRVAFYAREGERVFECDRPVGKKPKQKLSKEFIIFEPAGEPPFWWPECIDVTKALAEWLRLGWRLRKESWSESFGIFKGADEFKTPTFRPGPAQEELDAQYAEEDRRYDETVVNIRTKVLEQAGDDTFELLPGRAVPRAPFWNWALGRTSLKHLAPPWDCVSPSGMKLPNDDPYHTDWMLGGGFDLREDYKHDAPVYDAALDKMWAIQNEVGDFQCAVLNGGQEVRGFVGTDIAVVPDLSADRIDILKWAKAIITEQGGQLAHLAQVALEKSIPVMRVPNAMTAFPEKTELTLHPDEGRIHVHYKRW